MDATVNSTSLEQKQKEYKEYIDNHIENVNRAYRFYGKKACERLNVDYDRLGDMIKDHDLSKYTPEEFNGYRVFFYPTEEEKADKEGAEYRKALFDAAWLHHLRNNAHHPEFWIHMNDDERMVYCETMDPLHIIEMLLDWAAMGVVKKDTAYEYWNSNIDSKPFSRESVEIIDRCIDIFKDHIPDD